MLQTCLPPGSAATVERGDGTSSVPNPSAPLPCISPLTSPPSRPPILPLPESSSPLRWLTSFLSPRVPGPNSSGPLPLVGSWVTEP